VLPVDPAAAALGLFREAARVWLGEGAVTRTLPVRARGEALPLSDARADAIVLVDVVEHLTQPKLARLLAECARVLRAIIPAGFGRLRLRLAASRLLAVSLSLR